MRRPRYKLQVSTFPFLAVLLCAMGSLLLFLFIMDRRAKIAAQHANDEVLAERRKRSQREEEEIKAEWEKAKKELHEALVLQEAQLASQVKGLVIDMDSVGEKLRLAKVQQKDLDAEAKAEAAKIAEIQLQIAGRRRGLLEADKKETMSKKELIEATRELAELEISLQQLLSFKEREKNLHSLVPYRGKHGDTRVPVYVECIRDGIIFHPNEVALRGLDFGTGAIRTEVERRAGRLVPARAGGDKSGDKSETYVLFLVRPSGISSYYRAQAALRGFRLDFGYELIDQDWELDFGAGRYVKNAPDGMPRRPQPSPGTALIMPGTMSGAGGTSGTSGPGGNGSGLAGIGGPSGFGGAVQGDGRGAAFVPIGKAGAPVAGASNVGFSSPISLGGPNPFGGNPYPGSGGSGQLGGPNLFGGNPYPGAGGSQSGGGAGQSGGPNLLGGNPFPGAGGGTQFGGGSGQAGGPNQFGGNPYPGGGWSQAGAGSGQGGRPNPFSGNPYPGGAMQSGGGSSPSTGPNMIGGNPYPGGAMPSGGGSSPSGGPNTSGGNTYPGSGGVTSQAGGGGASLSGGPNLLGGNLYPGGGGSAQAGASANPGGGATFAGGGNAQAGSANAGGQSNGGDPATAGGLPAINIRAPGSPGQPAPAGSSANQANPPEASAKGPAPGGAIGGGGEPSAGGDGGGISMPPSALDRFSSTKAARKPLPSPALSRLLGNKDFLITIDCYADFVTVSPGGMSFRWTAANSKSADEAFSKAIGNLIERRQASVLPGEPPYRPLISFRVTADGRPMCLHVYPLLEPLRVPMTRENVID